MIRPGGTFFDILPDGRYERCVLQPGTDKTAMRGGTGEFYRAIPREELTEERMDAAKMIWANGGFVFLERES